MKTNNKLVLATVSTAILTLVASLALAQGRHGPGQGPPDAAFDACSNANEGDECSVAHDGRQIEGTCRVPRRDDDRGALLCVPDRRGKQ